MFLCPRERERVGLSIRAGASTNQQVAERQQLEVLHSSQYCGVSFFDNKLTSFDYKLTSFDDKLTTYTLRLAIQAYGLRLQADCNLTSMTVCTDQDNTGRDNARDRLAMLPRQDRPRQALEA
jgi:hypothetical protein